MDLLIRILLFFCVSATPQMLTDEQFINDHRELIDYSNTCIQNSRYRMNDGGVIVDVGVGT
jgi:hypothetical protein